MNTEREQVIEKIKKLLALSGNNPSEQEATAAALKAQALIARFNVQEAELAEQGETPIAMMSGIGQHKNWRFSLANVVARNFRCETYQSVATESVFHYDSGRKTKRVKSRDVVFFGYSMDAQAALLTFESLYKTGHRLANAEARKARELYGYSDGVYSTFAAGFVRGVGQELETQAQALMIAVPPLVKDAYRQIAFDASIPRTRDRRSRYLAYDASDEGLQAGRDAVRSKRLAESDAHLIAAR